MPSVYAYIFFFFCDSMRFSMYHLLLGLRRFGCIFGCFGKIFALLRSLGLQNQIDTLVSKFRLLEMAIPPIFIALFLFLSLAFSLSLSPLLHTCLGELQLFLFSGGTWCVRYVLSNKFA